MYVLDHVCGVRIFKETDKIMAAVVAAAVEFLDEDPFLPPARSISKRRLLESIVCMVENREIFE